jgi:hypothetical protein
MFSDKVLTTFGILIYIPEQSSISAFYVWLRDRDQGRLVKRRCRLGGLLVVQELLGRFLAIRRLKREFVGVLCLGLIVSLILRLLNPFLSLFILIIY